MVCQEGGKVVLSSLLCLLSDVNVVWMNLEGVFIVCLLGMGVNWIVCELVWWEIYLWEYVLIVQLFVWSMCLCIWSFIEKIGFGLIEFGMDIG